MVPTPVERPGITGTCLVSSVEIKRTRQRQPHTHLRNESTGVSPWKALELPASSSSSPLVWPEPLLVQTSVHEESGLPGAAEVRPPLGTYATTLFKETINSTSLVHGLVKLNHWLWSDM